MRRRTVLKGIGATALAAAVPATGVKMIPWVENEERGTILWNSDDGVLWNRLDQHQPKPGQLCDVHVEGDGWTYDMQGPWVTRAASVPIEPGAFLDGDKGLWFSAPEETYWRPA